MAHTLKSVKEVKVSREDLFAGVGSKTVCAIAGISYRQLGYWVSKELVEPTFDPQAGAGYSVIYELPAILHIVAGVELMKAGMSLDAAFELAEPLARTNPDDILQYLADPLPVLLGDVTIYLSLAHTTLAEVLGVSRVVESEGAA